MKFKAILTLILLLSAFAVAQREHPKRPTPSGGPLEYTQAAYNVLSYDITARVEPKTKSISGTTIMEAQVVAPTRWITIDLDTPFEVTDVRVWKYDAFEKVNFKRKGGEIHIEFDASKQTGETFQTSISYEGKPRIAPNPPWVGGFMWEKTADGSDWIVVACQNDGGDLWYPIKDHPSDEPNNVSLHITVPDNLYVATVGKLVKSTQNNDGTKTFDWHMSNPINNYNVVLNIAPYQLVEDKYKSIAGEEFPIIFYSLPESTDKARDIVDQTKTFLAFYEKYAGPFPYRAEKLGIVETPHLGMEHSTIIAYGNKFRKDASGFDWLMLHELGHEWWGNMVTASDWRDMWIHEGFQSFFDSLYLEETKGREAYLRSMQGKMKNTNNIQPLAPREPRFAYQIYFQPPKYETSDGDVYGKGAAVLHTLRYLIGDEAFFKSVRRMAYPVKSMESIVTGKQNRLVTTDDFKQIAEEESGMDLD
ncbi:MAG: M1 family metallopeptidase, partial [Pyrinomonadaceae bacterium]|nr:M1 family metallopeptidase [Pyrinomonadaceae bacterium]